MSLQISTSSDSLRRHPLMNLLNHKQLFLELRGKGKAWRQGLGRASTFHTKVALGPADTFQATFPGTSGPFALSAP